jgi:hypothetical protein
MPTYLLESYMPRAARDAVVAAASLRRRSCGRADPSRSARSPSPLDRSSFRKTRPAASSSSRDALRAPSAKPARMTPRSVVDDGEGGWPRVLASGGLFLSTGDCRATHEELKSRGVEFLQEPTEQPYGVDAGFRDPWGTSSALCSSRSPDFHRPDTRQWLRSRQVVGMLARQRSFRRRTPDDR